MEITVRLKSTTPYSQGKHYEVEKKTREQAGDYEERTWRERLHVDDKTDEVFIPAMAFKNCLAEAAKYMSIQIPGKGKATYTKHFEAGVLVIDKTFLGVKKKDVRGEWYFVPSNGQRGHGTRVKKCFPVIDSWEADVTFHILDEIITEEVFMQHLKAAGSFIGVGRFRPRNNGYYGRFVVVK